MSKFNTTKKKKKKKNVIKCAQNLKCVNNHYAKFEYKGMKTVGVTDYLNQTHPFRKDTCVSLTLLKNEKIFIKCAQNRGGGGAHLQCVNNHYA